jgi:RNA-directed DNA polymerase
MGRTLLQNMVRGDMYQGVGTRMGGWAVAQNPIMITTITLERLYKRGYEAMLDYYSKVSPELNEPSR